MAVKRHKLCTDRPMTIKPLDIKAILIDQQSEIELERRNRNIEWIERSQSKNLRSFLKSRLVKTVMGVRRSGKSTLCQSVCGSAQIAYVNFDDERFIAATSSDLNNIYEILLQIYNHAIVYLLRKRDGES